MDKKIIEQRKTTVNKITETDLTLAYHCHITREISPLTRAQAVVHANLRSIKSLGNPSDAMSNMDDKMNKNKYFLNPLFKALSSILKNTFLYIASFCTTALG